MQKEEQILPEWLWEGEPLKENTETAQGPERRDQNAPSDWVWGAETYTKVVKNITEVAQNNEGAEKGKKLSITEQSNLAAGTTPPRDRGSTRPGSHRGSGTHSSNGRTAIKKREGELKKGEASLAKFAALVVSALAYVTLSLA